MSRKFIQIGIRLLQSDHIAPNAAAVLDRNSFHWGKWQSRLLGKDQEKILNLAWTVLHLRPLLILAFANLEQSTSFHNFKVGDWEVFLKWKPRPSPTGYGYRRRPPGVGSRQRELKNARAPG